MSSSKSLNSLLMILINHSYSNLSDKTIPLRKGISIKIPNLTDKTPNKFLRKTMELHRHLRYLQIWECQEWTQSYLVLSRKNKAVKIILWKKMKTTTTIWSLGGRSQRMIKFLKNKGSRCIHSFHICSNMKIKLKRSAIQLTKN